MIVKEIDFKSLNNKYEKSGFEAEKQMSFYLKRAFSEDDNVYVINDLRLQVEDEYAQIDHLVLHQYGFIIIESKSVTDKICVNKYGEWKRIYHNQESGMPSPIQQAKRQIDILKKFLLSKNSRGIDKFPYDTLVAISDSGIIERDNIELDEICKADSVTEHIENISQGYKKESKKFLTLKRVRSFEKENISKLANFLVNSHQPKGKKVRVQKERVQKEVIKTPRKKPVLKNACKECHSSNLEIRNGRYGYYFKCLDCDKNTKIELICSKPTKECKPTLAKKGLKFYKQCKGCGEEKLFFTNIEKKLPAKKSPLAQKKTSSKLSQQCKKCKSTDITIEYGKYGYYFRCKACETTSKINLTCTKPSCQPKLKKEKENFYKVCQDCKTKELFFTSKKNT